MNADLKTVGRAIQRTQTRAEPSGDGRQEAPVTRKAQTGTRISVTYSAEVAVCSRPTT